MLKFDYSLRMDGDLFKMLENVIVFKYHNILKIIIFGQIFHQCMKLWVQHYIVLC